MTDMTAAVVLKLKNKLTEQMKKVQKQFAILSKTVEQINKPSRGGGLGKQFSDAEKKARHLRLEIGKLKGVMSSVKLHAGKLFGRAGIAGMIFGGAKAGMVAAGAPMLGTAAQFEKLSIMLKNATTSAKEFEAAQKFIFDFEAGTPFNLQEVTQAYISLRSMGLDPMKGSLLAAGEAASGTGKDLMQAVEAIKDAATGEFERLKEFQVTSSTKNGKSTLFYTSKTGEQKEITVNLRDQLKLSESINKIWTEKFGGSVQTQSKGWGGIVSSLESMRAKFELMVMESGPFARFKSMLENLLGKLQQWEADGTMKRFAETFAQNINGTFDRLVPIAQGAWAAGQKVFEVIDGIAKAAGGYDKLAYFVTALWMAGPALSLIVVAGKAAAIMTTIGAVATGGAAVGLAGMAVGLAGIATALGAIWLAWDDTIFTKLQNFRPGESKGKAFGTINDDDSTLMKNLKALATLDAEWSRIIEEELDQALARLGTALYNFGANMVQSIVDGIVGAAYKVGAALNSIVPETTPNPGTYMGPRRGFVQPAPSDPVQPRAMGGSIYSGGTYLTGERGPELITAGRGGHVTANSDLAKRFGNAGNTVNINISGNTVNGGSTENALSKLADMISKRVSTGLHDGAYV